MSQKPNKKTEKAARQNTPMTTGMKLIVAGCVAELYLLIVRRFYYQGTLDQVLAWYDYLKILSFIGWALGGAGVGIIRASREKKKRRMVGWYALGAGVFLALTSGLAHWNMSTVPLMVMLVPAALVLVVLWSLFDHDSALPLTVLALGIFPAWLCSYGSAGTAGRMVKAITVAVILVLVVLCGALKQGKLKRWFSADTEKNVFSATVVAVIGAAVGLVSTAAAYYAMWALATVFFCAIVYYTVRQL